MNGQQTEAIAAFKAASATKQFQRAEYQAARLELHTLGELVD